MEKSYKVFSIFNLVITVSRGYNSTRFLKFFRFWFVRISKVSLGIGQGKLHSSLVTSKEVLAVWTFVGDCIKWIDATWNAGTTPKPKNWKFVALQTWFLKREVKKIENEDRSQMPHTNKYFFCKIWAEEMYKYFVEQKNSIGSANTINTINKNSI